MSECTDRKKLVADKLRQTESDERAQAEAVRREVFKFLTTARGYAPKDVEQDVRFTVRLGDCEDTAVADLIISPGGKRFMAIICAPGSVDSRLRHVVSLCRVGDTQQIPLGMVTDGGDTRIMDAATGEVLSEDIMDLPGRDEAVALLDRAVPLPFPPERVEREKRILLAFVASTSTEGDG